MKILYKCQENFLIINGVKYKNVEKKLNRIFQYKEKDLKKNIATKHIYKKFKLSLI